jgi:hypothetical protein
MPPSYRSLLTGLLLTMAMVTRAAEPAQPADLFDFWIGDWDVSWKNADGTPGKGHNRVVKSSDGQVIEEQFEDFASQAPLRGRSISVLQRASGRWRQAWADNQGGFFVFTASVDDERRIFATELTTDGDKVKGQRMVFHSIRRDSFAWDWQGTIDGGRSWQLLWHIDYRRR